MKGQNRDVFLYGGLALLGGVLLTAVRVWSLFLDNGPVGLAVAVLEGVIVFGLAAVGIGLWVRRSARG